ncbi:MAG: winged helix-turn-helix domain-containing protein [Anaerolineae bacterium]|nr:winged helix-turn-helix domain-containing protein [Anaerolineae bacterium]
MATGNPFLHRGPIRDPDYFFGRRREVNRAFDLLRNAQSVSIVGPRRIGKSSLLFHLANPAIYQQYGLSPDKYCFIYVDCEGWSELTRNDFYALLLNEMKEALLRMGLASKLELPATASISFRGFEQAVRTIVSRQIQPVFLLDEFEALSCNPHLDAHFFSSLRGLATRHSVAYVTVSKEHLLKLTYAQTDTISSPFFNFFAQIRLHPFFPDEAELLVTDLATKGGLNFDPTTKKCLFNLAGPHPFLLQVAAYHAFDHLTVGSTFLNGTGCDHIRRQFLGEAEAHWAYAWSQLSPLDRKYLTLLPLTQQSNLRVVRRLQEAGVVVPHTDGFVPLSPAFREFVARQPVGGVIQAYPVILDLEQRRALLRDRLLSLTPIEFDLLAYLVEHAGEVITHDQLISQVWSDQYPEDHHQSYVQGPDRLKTGVKMLRRALGDDAQRIENVRGLGYKYSKG